MRKKSIPFPIRIDNFIFEEWEHERKADVLKKVVGDFEGWDQDAAKYKGSESLELIASKIVEVESDALQKSLFFIAYDFRAPVYF